jgi:hypothetical protein
LSIEHFAFAGWDKIARVLSRPFAAVVAAGTLILFAVTAAAQSAGDAAGAVAAGSSAAIGLPAGSRVTYSMTPLMFAGALLQYNSTNHVVSANARLRWEYAPGSELFVVYNEERDTVSPRFPDLANRSFIIKVNRLLRF